VLPVLLHNLRPEYRALLQYREGKQHDALAELRSFIGSGDFRNSDRAAASVALFGTLAEASDSDTLLSLTHDLREDVRQGALIGLLRTDRPRALALAPELVNHDSGFARAIMQHLSGGCDNSVKSFLATQLGSSNQARIPEVLDAALRLGCAINTQDLLRAVAKSISVPDRNDIAMYALISRGTELRKTARSILASFPHVRPKEVDVIRNLIDIAAITVRPDCPTEVLRYRKNAPLVVSKRAYIAGIYSCNKLVPTLLQELNLSPRLRHDDQVLTALVQSGLTRPDEALGELLGRQDTGGLLLVLDAIIKLRSGFSQDNARRLLQYQDESVRERTLAALRLSGSPWAEVKRFFFDSSLNVEREAYRLFLRDHSREAVALLIDRMGDDSAGYLPALLGQQLITDEERDRIRKYLGGTSLERKNAAATLVMLSDQHQALELLKSGDFYIRNSAADYVGYRPDLSDTIAKLERDNRVSEVPVMVAYVGSQLVRRNSLKTELDRAPGWSRLWRAELMTRASDEGSAAGLTAWLDRETDQLRGVPEDSPGLPAMSSPSPHR
jgi:hypothetical protein